MSEQQVETGIGPADGKSGPWYRYPFVWMVIAGPAIVVVAAIYTAIIAHQGADLLVNQGSPEQTHAYADVSPDGEQDVRLLPADKVRKMGADADKAATLAP